MNLRVAIIGCGAIARRAHLPGFSKPGSAEAGLSASGYQFDGCEDTKIVAVVDTDRQKAEAASRDFNVPEVSQNWSKVVSGKEVDAVSIALPNYLHAAVAIEAMRRGKHVLVEKPMAISVEDADRMVAESKKAGVVLMAEQTMRFQPANNVAKELVAKGVIGEVRTFRSRHSHPGPQNWSAGSDWFFDPQQAGGGTIVDLGVHNIDFIRWLIGAEVVEVAAFASSRGSQGKEIDYDAASVLRFVNGTLGVAEMSWTTQPGDNSTILYGEKGNLVISKRAPHLYVDFPEKEPLIFNLSLPAGTIENARFIPAIPSSPSFGGPFRHFVNCIKRGTAPVVSCEDSRQTVSVILAILESARSRTFVRPR